MTIPVLKESHVSSAQVGDVLSPVLPVLPLDATLGHLIRRAHQVHTALWTAQFHGDLTGPQYAVLSALAGTSGLDQRSAGRMASLDKSTTADVVARLLRNGWISRAPDSNDARRKVVVLSKAARAALREVTPLALDVQKSLLEPLTPTMRPRFVTLLSRVSFKGEIAPTGGTDLDVSILALATTPGHLIRRAEQVHGGIWATVVGNGVMPSQFSVLSALAATPSIDQTAAGELASLDKSSVADIVARLVRKGWIIASQDSIDKRRKQLALSQLGIDLLLAATPRVIEVQSELSSPLSEPQAQNLIKMLNKVAYGSR